MHHCITVEPHTLTTIYKHNYSLKQLTWMLSLSPEPLTAVKNEDSDAIVMRNTKPLGWGGHAVDFLLYRDSYVWTVMPGIPPGSTAQLPLSHELGFGVVRGCVERGSTLESLSELLYHYSVDMAESASTRQLEVILEYNEVTREFLFSSEKCF